jgi:hypothetical protein
MHIKSTSSPSFFGAKPLITKQLINQSTAIFLSFFACANLFAQSETPEIAQQQDSTLNLYKTYFEESGAFPKKAVEVLKQFSVNGYYRFITNYRHLDQAYSHLEKNKNNLFVGDDSQIPQLMLNISGSVTKNTSFGTDLFIWTPMTGAGVGENVKGLNLGVSLYGTYSSKFGDFTVRTGGINWHSLSPFTFQTNRGYNRYSIFERNPWDPNTKSLDTRYNTFYNAGGINQDQRWGQQAFQGLIVDAKNMPKGFSGSFMYGKTELNGGLSPLPNSSFGGLLKKKYGKSGAHFVSLNTFNNTTYTDSTQRKSAGFNVATLEFKNQFKHFTIKGEMGAGQAVQQDTSRGWGEAISLKISTDIIKKMPFEVHLYRISPKVINNSAIFINTAITEQQVGPINTSTQVVLPAVASAMAPIGQLTNNRQGADLNTQIDIGKLKTSIGYSTSMELESLSSSLTYAHPVNALALAHFWRWGFPSNVGPYKNLSKVYRSVYETVNLTKKDANGLTAQQKYFNSIEINSKLKVKLFEKDLYLCYLGQLSSAQSFLSPVTVFDEKALVRTYYNQFETYFVLSPGVIWCNYVGYERIIASYDTETDAISKRPKNQTGLALATGFDIRLSKGAGLCLRQRWMDYKDTSFEKDQYKGFETTAEIKVFF